jgi:hypothetical protein
MKRPLMILGSMFAFVSLASVLAAQGSPTVTSVAYSAALSTAYYSPNPLVATAYCSGGPMGNAMAGTSIPVEGGDVYVTGQAPESTTTGSGVSWYDVGASASYPNE